MGWVLRIKRESYSTLDQYDDDELGTLDDTLTGLFITELAGIEKLTIEKVD